MQILTIIFQLFLISVFLLTASTMLAGAKMQVEAFRHLGLPRWFRIVTALVQLTGALGLLIGFRFHGLAAWAGIWLGITMLVGFLLHIRVRDPIGKSMPAFILAIVAIGIAFVHSAGLSHPFQ